VSIIDQRTTTAAPRSFTSFIRGGQAAAPAQDELPSATTWLNVGYVVPSTKEGEPDKFVSLPRGIPLDTMKSLEPARGADLNALRSAQNDFMVQMQEAAAKLQPGEDIIIGIEGGLCIQLRKVLGAPEAAAADDANPYARKFSFAG
jgi:hypothetical protein